MTPSTTTAPDRNTAAQTGGATAEHAAAQLPDGTWQLDPVHSLVGFEVKHLGVSTFRGRFDRFRGEVTTAGGELADIEGTIEIASIDVRDDKLGGHLQSADFFDADNHPEGHLSSTSLTPLGEGRYRLDGELTLRGNTNPVSFEVTTEGPHPGPAGQTLGIAGETRINRSDYGISWEAKLDNGALVVAEQVRLRFEVEAVLAE